MDPLSITTSIIALTGTCLNTVKHLSDLRTRYRLASMTLTNIINETTVISASLGQIQTALLRSTFMVQKHLERSPGLVRTIDAAFAGCSTVIFALEEELEQIDTGVYKACLDRKNGPQEISAMAKAKMLWNESRMKSLLEQVRGQQTSMSLLLQALNIDSMSELHELMTMSTSMLENLTKSTSTILKSYPNIRTPRSIFEADRDDGVSVFSQRASTAGVTEFDFDNFIIDSRVYRRAFTGGYLRPRHTTADDSDEEESDTNTITHIPSEEQNSDEDNKKPSIRTPTKDRSISGSTKVASSKDSTDTSIFTTQKTQFVETPGLSGQVERNKTTTDSYTSTIRDWYDWDSLKSAYDGKPESFMAIAQGKGLFDPKDVDLRSLLVKHEELLEKYRKVKKYYFDKDAQLQAMRQKSEYNKDEEVKSLYNEITDLKGGLRTSALENTSLREQIEKLHTMPNLMSSLSFEATNPEYYVRDEINYI